MNITTVQPCEFAALYKGGEEIDLIDVRTPAEFREVHVDGARNIPLEQIDASAILRSGRENVDKPVYMICQSGSRGRQACERLHKAGVAGAVNIEGGTLACIKAGLPLVRGQRVMSLERQVRITAGSLVLIGIGLGWLVHSAFFGVSAFVGGGLVFSGVTDTCGIGTVLARMPWNFRGTSDAAS